MLLPTIPALKYHLTLIVTCLLYIQCYVDFHLTTIDTNSTRKIQLFGEESSHAELTVRSIFRIYFRLRVYFFIFYCCCLHKFFFGGTPPYLRLTCLWKRLHVEQGTRHRGFPVAVLLTPGIHPVRVRQHA